MITGEDIILREKDYAATIDALTCENPEQAEDFCALLISGNGDGPGPDRAVSGAYARCLCRFLLHKKNKSRLIEIIRDNRIIREAVFGRLNTYKYSLVFMMKRVFRQNDVVLTGEILALLANNPFRDEQAKPYADRWSLGFLICETLKAPADYMNLSDESLKIIQAYLTESE